MGYPKEQDYEAILDRTTGDSEVQIQPGADAAEIVKLRHVVRSVPVPSHAKRYAIHLVMATQPGSQYAPAMVNEYVALGSSSTTGFGARHWVTALLLLALILLGAEWYWQQKGRML